MTEGPVAALLPATTLAMLAPASAAHAEEPAGPRTGGAFRLGVDLVPLLYTETTTTPPGSAITISEESFQVGLGSTGLGAELGGMVAPSLGFGVRLGVFSDDSSAAREPSTRARVPTQPLRRAPRRAIAARDTPRRSETLQPPDPSKLTLRQFLARHAEHAPTPAVSAPAPATEAVPETGANPVP
ncbi:MAG: hypothetical protein OXT09_27945 [Myxococcales bacterium]|nr:hypothetical protein [Myxococcales bacterium]